MSVDAGSGAPGAAPPVTMSSDPVVSNGSGAAAELSTAPRNKELFDLGRERRVALKGIAERRGFRAAS
jgi:hypothetical protein